MQAWITWVHTAPNLVVGDAVGALALASAGWLLGASGRRRWWATIPVAIGAGGLTYIGVQSPPALQPLGGMIGALGALIGLLAWTIQLRRHRRRAAAEPPDEVRQRIRENFAQADRITDAEALNAEPLALAQAQAVAVHQEQNPVNSDPIGQNTVISDPLEDGSASAAAGPTDESPADPHHSGVRYDAERDVLLISFGWTHAAVRREVADEHNQAIAGFYTVHDLSDDAVVGVEIHGFLGRHWQPQWAQPVSPPGTAMQELIAEIRATLETYEQQLQAETPAPLEAPTSEASVTELPILAEPSDASVPNPIDRVADNLSRRLSPILAEALHEFMQEAALSIPGDAR